jgi:hypothetical protein
MIQPSPTGRVDVGLILKNQPPAGRLKLATGFNAALFTHRVRVASVAEVDDQLIGWLKHAHDRAT